MEIYVPQHAIPVMCFAASSLYHPYIPINPADPRHPLYVPNFASFDAPSQRPEFGSSQGLTMGCRGRARSVPDYPVSKLSGYLCKPGNGLFRAGVAFTHRGCHTLLNHRGQVRTCREPQTNLIFFASLGKLRIAMKKKRILKKMSKSGPTTTRCHKDHRRNLTT